MSNSPCVVIGLPVYNGENFLQAAIESVLAQTFTDFQLVISDNASTDATPEICQEYVKQDDRVVYYRQSQNIGGAPNFNYLFEHHVGNAPYFRWQAHDDTIEPMFLRRCVDLLKADSTLAIAHSRAKNINEHGVQEGTYDGEVRLNADAPSDRFWRLLWAGYFTEVFGLMRSDMIRRTKLQGSFAGGDRNFLAEMLLQGNVGYVEEYLFARRDHPDCYCRLQTTDAKNAWFDPKAKNLRALGAIKAKAYLSAIARLPMPLSEKVRCVKMLTEWTLRRGIESATGAGEQFGEKFRREFAGDLEVSA